MSRQKVDEENGQGSQGKIDAPDGVSILLKTYANPRAWCIGRLTPLHTFATHHRHPDGDYISKTHKELLYLPLQE